MERRELPTCLLALHLGMDAVAAANEAEGVRENRLQNLAITIDKAKFFLRHQPAELSQARSPCLTCMKSWRQVCMKQIWTG